MTRIGGNGQLPGKPDAVQREQTRQAANEAGTTKGAETTNTVDGFERGAPGINSQLGAMAGKKVTTPALSFASEHLEQAARAFAGMLRKNPDADRKTRARMFAQALLRSRKLGKLFDTASEEELEALYEEIAGQLDDSPVLAQLVEQATEATRKLSPG